MGFGKVFRGLFVGIFLLLIATSTLLALPAFPGAEGFGAGTPGGRGGRVIYVTNLNDSGPGSLRAACQAKGPRMVLFKVGGTINLKSHIRINNPYITIAGQTAPGDGILLKGAGLWIETHDVVIRFLRVRVGASLAEPYNRQDAIHIEGRSAYNIIIDHCSFSWSMDECASVRGPAHDVTFSWNIISEALAEPFSKEVIGKERSHSMGMLLGGEATRCSIHHNLFAHNNSRNPRVQGGVHVFVNNVFYDWRYLTGTFSRNPRVNFIGNYYKAGPASRKILPICGNEDMGLIYVKGNISPYRPDDSMPEWEFTVGGDSSEHKASKPFPMPEIKTTSAEEAYLQVLLEAGATIPHRDEVDRRIVRDTALGLGTSIDRPEEVGGFPVMRVGVPPADSDGDGMPDWWEKEQGFDPENPNDGRDDRDGDGYTNLEEYLNWIVKEWEDSLYARTGHPYHIPQEYMSKTSPYEVFVDGNPVPIEEVGSGTEDAKGPDKYKAYYARIEQGTLSRVVVGIIDAEGQIQWEIEPERYAKADNARIEEDKLVLEPFLSGPRVVKATVDGEVLPHLFILIDKPIKDAPKPQNPRVINVLEYVEWNSKGLQTEALQRALDDCSKIPGGGILYFPNGIYRTGPLHIGSNTTLYLEGGAYIVASTNPQDYPDLPDEGKGFITFKEAVNSSIIGHGTIDAQGHIVRNTYGIRAHALFVVNSSNVRIEGVVLRDSPSWTLHTLGCDGVVIKDVKILSDWAVRNTDGIDLDSTKNAFVERYFGWCGDDGFVLKTTGKLGILSATENVRLRDAVIVTYKTSLKLGTESRADMRNALISDVDIVDSSRGIGLWMRDGATFKNVTFRDITMDLREFEGENLSGEPFRITIENRSGVGKIQDILFDRITSYAPFRSVIYGYPSSWVEGLKFWGCKFIVRPRQIKDYPQALFEVRRARDVEFRLTEVDWRIENKELWNGFIGASQVEGLFIVEMKETGEIP